MIQPLCTCGRGEGTGRTAGAVAIRTGAGAGAAAGAVGTGRSALGGAGAGASLASSAAGGRWSGTIEAVCTAPPGFTSSVFTGTGRIGSGEPVTARGAGTGAIATGSGRSGVLDALAGANPWALRRSATLGSTTFSAGLVSAILGSTTVGPFFFYDTATT